MSPRTSRLLASLLSLGAIALTTSVLQPGAVGASPIFANDTTLLSRNSDPSTGLGGNDGHLLQSRKKSQKWDDLMLYGWRIVEEAKAAEYDSKGELTNIPATKTSLGEGAYLVQDLGTYLPEHVSPTSGRDCIVAGSAQKIKAASKKFLSDSSLKDVFNNPEGLQKELEGAKLKVADTILASKFVINQLGAIDFQMLIPPHYLPKSDLPVPSDVHSPTPGENILETKVFCAPLGCFTNPPSARWETLFDNFGQNNAHGGNFDRVKPAHCPKFPDWVKELLRPSGGSGGLKGFLKNVAGKGK